jgi:hypothetical protein
MVITFLTMHIPIHPVWFKAGEVKKTLAAHRVQGGEFDGDLVWEAFIALIAHHQLTGSLEPFAHGAVCEVEAQCRIGLIALRVLASPGHCQPCPPLRLAA